MTQAFDLFPLCRCGYVDALVARYHQVVRWVDQRDAQAYTQGNRHDDTGLLIHSILYVLDAMGYTEHSTTVQGSWLTALGKVVPQWLDADEGHYTEAPYLLADQPDAPATAGE